MQTLRKLAHGAAALSLFAAPMIGAIAPLAAHAEGLQRDSDDHNCYYGGLDDPRTVEACTRLRGHFMSADAVAAERRGGLQRDSDDYNCHHGRRGAHRTVEACARLRGRGDR